MQNGVIPPAAAAVWLRLAVLDGRQQCALYISTAMHGNQQFSAILSFDAHASEEYTKHYDVPGKDSVRAKQ